MAEPVTKKPPKPHGLNWRPVVDEYRQKTDRTDAGDPEDADHAAADPQKEDAMVSPVNLRKFQEQCGALREGYPVGLSTDSTGDMGLKERD